MFDNLFNTPLDRELIQEVKILCGISTGNQPQQRLKENKTKSRQPVATQSAASWLGARHMGGLPRGSRGRAIVRGRRANALAY
jgi:hypothetical protein